MHCHPRARVSACLMIGASQVCIGTDTTHTCPQLCQLVRQHFCERGFEVAMVRRPLRPFWRPFD
jgi:hypothetical protein